MANGKFKTYYFDFGDGRGFYLSINDDRFGIIQDLVDKFKKIPANKDFYDSDTFIQFLQCKDFIVDRLNPTVIEF